MIKVRIKKISVTIFFLVNILVLIIQLPIVLLLSVHNPWLYADMTHDWGKESNAILALARYKIDVNNYDPLSLLLKNDINKEIGFSEAYGCAYTLRDAGQSNQTFCDPSSYLTGNQKDALQWLSCDSILFCETGLNEFLLGEDMIKRGLVNKGFFWLRRSAALGYPTAVNLSKNVTLDYVPGKSERELALYLKRQHVGTMDKALVDYLFVKAAFIDDSSDSHSNTMPQVALEARYAKQLGRELYYGIGVAPDKESALFWLSKAEQEIPPIEQCQEILTTKNRQ